MKSNSMIKASIFTAIALLGVQHAQADNVVPVQTQNVSLYGQLDALRSENALLTEALKKAELKKKINSEGAGEKIMSGVDSTPSPTPSISQKKAVSMPTMSLTAQVQMVSDTGDNLRARILLSNGGYVNARIGSNIAGLGTVKSISLNEVLVVNKTQTISLPFASESSYNQSTGNTNMPSSSTLPAFPMPPIPISMMPGGGR